MDREWTLLLMVFTLIMGGALAVIYVSYSSQGQDIGSSVSTSTTSTTSSTSSTTTSTAAFATIMQTTTTIPASTTSVLAANIELTYSPETVFHGDELNIIATSDGYPLVGAAVVMDGYPKGKTDANGQYAIKRMVKGERTISVQKTGYKTESVGVEVKTYSYMHSSLVRQKKSSSERQAEIAKGKVVVILYDWPNCQNCLNVKRALADIVPQNRGCISYEWLNTYLDRDVQQELYGLLGAKNFVTPYVIIHGPGGEYHMNGAISSRTLNSRIKSASSNSCPIT